MEKSKFKVGDVLNGAVIVSTLGYFVDIYDLVLFSIVRVASLRGIGVPEEKLLEEGVYLINMQMGGMLLGGLLWGILGDKKGRVSVLFGSIFLYSIANILNAFVTNVEMYGAFRLLAGIGLAGELGAAITLVSEVMHKEKRGYGTTAIATIGVLGALLAGYVGQNFDWKTAYIVGGALGFSLLALRMSTMESGMFKSALSKETQRGNFLMLFNSWVRFKKYLCSITIGLPIWYTIGILVTFSPELAKAVGVTGPIEAGRSIMFTYAGLSVGDLASGLISQYLRSRRKTVFYFLIFITAGIIFYHTVHGLSVMGFYWLCVFLGFSSGFWCIFVSAAAEQFGTNLRATVTTTVPNFNRGSVVPLTLSFRWLHTEGGYTLSQSSLIVGVVALGLAYWSLYHLDETFALDLDYLEK